MEYSLHSLILLAGFAVAGLALLGAIAVGPYGRRGARVILGMISFAACIGSVLGLISYLGIIDQRRAIETRLSELRAQALGAGSALACLERTGGLVEAACAQMLFAAPETLAAANFYTAARLDLLIASVQYRGPRTPQFNDAQQGLQRSLQQDPFGLTANILIQREGCTAQRCDAIGLFYDPARVWDNIRQKTFDANVARHAAAWRAPGGSAPAALTAPTGGETRAPIPDKYTLPSASSIPPVSIMSDEPLRPASPPAPAKDRAANPAQAASDAPVEQPPASAPAALPRTAQPPAQKQRRETTRPGAPLAINPTR